jgi:hypothetical protein
LFSAVQQIVNTDRIALDAREEFIREVEGDTPTHEGDRQLAPRSETAQTEVTATAAGRPRAGRPRAGRCRFRCRLHPG